MFANCILFATFWFYGYPCSMKENMALQCLESYGIWQTYWSMYPASLKCRSLKLLKLSAKMYILRFFMY